MSRIVDRAVLTEYIRQHGPVRAVRVSSAPAVGGWPYWHVRQYDVMISPRSGALVARPGPLVSGRTRSIRRAAAEASRLGPPVIKSIGRLSDADVSVLLQHVLPAHVAAGRSTPGGCHVVVDSRGV